MNDTSSYNSSNQGGSTYSSNVGSGPSTISYSDLTAGDNGFSFFSTHFN